MPQKEQVTLVDKEFSAPKLEVCLVNYRLNTRPLTALLWCPTITTSTSSQIWERASCNWSRRAEKSTTFSQFLHCGMLCLKVSLANKAVASGIPTSCCPWKCNAPSGQSIPLKHEFVTRSVCKLIAYAYVLICGWRKCCKPWVIFWREHISQIFFLLTLLI